MSLPPPAKVEPLSADKDKGRRKTFMPDYYNAPALILIALLLPAFGYLYFRFRDTRALLWFLGFLLALVSMVLLYKPWP
ncbi:MAG: hypothetical protein ACRD19_07630, partial [Terriglobia bacterium]